MNSNSYFNAFILVFLSGLFWSFGVVTVRYMVDAQDFVFQYLFYRGISIAIILLIYLFLKEGLVFYKNFFRIGISSILGGIFLATAFTGFIFSITMTTAAVTLFMLAAMPFIAAIAGYFILGEALRRTSSDPKGLIDTRYRFNSFFRGQNPNGALKRSKSWYRNT